MCQMNRLHFHIKAGSGKIIYSKYNFNSQSEEIIIYDAITKVKQVRLIIMLNMQWI